MSYEPDPDIDCDECEHSPKPYNKDPCLYCKQMNVTHQRFRQKMGVNQGVRTSE